MPLRLFGSTKILSTLVPLRKGPLPETSYHCYSKSEYIIKLYLSVIKISVLHSYVATTSVKIISFLSIFFFWLCMEAVWQPSFSNVENLPFLGDIIYERFLGTFSYNSYLNLTMTVYEIIIAIEVFFNGSDPKKNGTQELTL